MPRLLLIAASSYLFGSIPFGYLLIRICRGEDVRRSGSGNIGATNVARKSPALGVFTLLLDALKGSAAVAVGILMSPQIPDHAWLTQAWFTQAWFTQAWLTQIPWRLIVPAASHGFATVAAFAALFAVAGHMFPIWLKFRGGKGVATGLGAFLVISPKAVLLAAGVFILIVLMFRYVSLASIIAVAAFPNIALALHAYGNSAIALVLMAMASASIIIRHHENIRRLLAGTENRVGSKHA
jgi:glycerol-3-phosphate acyltransferase PlsY